MATTTISFEEFQQNAEKVREASADGPVFITGAGGTTLVVLDIAEYRKLSRKEKNDAEPVANPECHDIKFDRSRMTIEEYRKLTGRLPNIVDLLANPEGYDIEFDPPRMGTKLYEPVDLFE